MDDLHRRAPGLVTNTTLALAAILTLALPARAQIADVGHVDRPAHPDSTAMKFAAPADLGWDASPPDFGSPFESAGANIRNDLPQLSTASAADLDGILRYRLVGEHPGSFTGYSVSFSDDADCDGFTEVLIGAPALLRSGLAARPVGAGAAYLVSMADMAAADGADGSPDRVIDLSLIAAQPRSWKLLGQGSDSVGFSVSSSGDANGDGCSDLLIGAPGAAFSTGSAYVVSVFDLPAADAADGAADGVVEIGRIAAQPDSWELTGESGLFNAGRNTILAHDVNADGRSDLLISAWSYRANEDSAAYLLSGAALSSADAEDGVSDGRIELASVPVQPDSWKFVGENPGDRAGNPLSIANLDGDGRSDLVIGASAHTDGIDHQGAVYLISAAALPSMDEEDGRFDGVIDLANAADGGASWKLVGDSENQNIGFSSGDGGVTTGDVDGDGLDDVVVAIAGFGADDAEVFVVSGSDLPAADAADGSQDGVVRLGRALAQDDSFKLAWGDTHQFSVSSNVDLDGDGLDDILVGNLDFNEGAPCLPGGGSRGNGAVALVPGGSFRAADAEDGVTDSIIDLDRSSSRGASWRLIGGPTDRLGTSVTAGDVDGDGRLDPILASLIPHTPAYDCGSRDGNGFVFLMSGAATPVADAADGATDGEIHLEALDVSTETPITFMQFGDSVIMVRAPDQLRPWGTDSDKLIKSFLRYYEDVFDYLVFIPYRPHDSRYRYSAIYVDVRNSVVGTGKSTFDFGSQVYGYSFTG